MLIVELVVHLHVRAILTTTRLIFFHVYARLCVKRVNRIPENVGSRALCSTSERVGQQENMVNVTLFMGRSTHGRISAVISLSIIFCFLRSEEN